MGLQKVNCNVFEPVSDLILAAVVEVVGKPVPILYKYPLEYEMYRFPELI